MSVYERWITSRERSLTLRDRNRRIMPFDWGLEWLGEAPTGSAPLSTLKEYADRAMRNGDFFAVDPMKEYVLKDDLLEFPSPIQTPYPNNNTAYCRLFPAAGSRQAVIVVPQWNANSESHAGLCKLLRRLGITAARLCLPYHEARLPPDSIRADYMVSPNLGRTLQSTRQAVLEVRQLAAWLREMGYERIGVVGSSIGSCVTFLAFVNDLNICTGVFNHVSAYYADVVWTGLSTRYVRWGLEGHISLKDLHRCWAPISPWYSIPRLKQHQRPHLLITAKYDLSFIPELSAKVFEQYRDHGIEHQRADLPCGHYTTASFPFSYLDAWWICRFLTRNLPR